MAAVGTAATEAAAGAASRAGRRMKAWTKGDRVVQPTYGLGTLAEVNEHHTVINFDEHGRRVFATRLVMLQATSEPAPAKAAPQASDEGEDEDEDEDEGEDEDEDERGESLRSLFVIVRRGRIGNAESRAVYRAFEHAWRRQAGDVFVKSFSPCVVRSRLKPDTITSECKGFAPSYFRGPVVGSSREVKFTSLRCTTLSVA